MRMAGRRRKGLLRAVTRTRSRRRRLRMRLPDRPAGPASRIVTGGAGAAAGALLAFFLDPHSGKRRRHVVRDRARATVRRSVRAAQRSLRHTGREAYGMAQRVIHLRPSRDVPDDATLADRVRSEIFRRAHVPKGRINVNCENGVVFLRGELQTPEEIRELERATRKVPGVRGVRNLLHLPAAAPAPAQWRGHPESGPEPTRDAGQRRSG